MTTLDKCYSLNDEDFNFSELGDLIDSHATPKVGEAYWEADSKPCRATDGINGYTVESLLEGMDERIYEDVGEVYNNECSNVTDEAKAELHSLLEAWAAKHINLSRYWKIVGKSRECKFTAEDLASQQ
jgi:hypothetical protein